MSRIRMSETDASRLFGRVSRTGRPQPRAQRMLEDGEEQEIAPLVQHQKRHLAELAARVRIEHTTDGDYYHYGDCCAMLLPNGLLLGLPYPVSLNKLWATPKGKATRILSKPAGMYKRRIARDLKPILHRLGHSATRQSLHARIEVQPVANLKRNYSEATYPRYDVDNYVKCVFDALKGPDLVYGDDKQIVCNEVRFAAPVHAGRVWLALTVPSRSWLAAEVDLQWLSGGAA